MEWKRRREKIPEKQENLVEKLRRGVIIGRKVGPLATTTPIRPWKKKTSNNSTTTSSHYDHPSGNYSILDKTTQLEVEELLPCPKDSNSNNIYPTSVRKLGAALWEFQQYLPISEMHRGNSNNHNNHVGHGGGGDGRLRRYQNRHQFLFKDKGPDLSHFLPDPSPSSPDQPDSAASLRRHIAASLIQHHRSIERSNRALQPVSPASYGSSMEMAPYNPAATPSSSVEFKGRMGDAHYSLKTSTELLKVLNRIWSLEEQHASNMSLVKALKTELDHARVRIRELLRDKQADRQEMDDLMKQISEDKLVRKSKEQDRLHSVIQSVRGELEDERKLRKRSESLHRKLARELAEVKSSLSNAVADMERERKSRRMLEDLCDEFAKAIKFYEHKMHSLKQKSDKDWVGRDDSDHLIVHLSESWLDERMQMKLEEGQNGIVDNNSVVDKLGLEIEAFLKATQMDSSRRSNRKKMAKERRTSMESVPLNEVVSAPRGTTVDDEDSEGSDSHCFELNEPSNGNLANTREVEDDEEEAGNRHIDETRKAIQMNKRPASRDRSGGRIPSHLQVKFEEQMAWAMSTNGKNRSQAASFENVIPNEGNPIEVSVSPKLENYDPAHEVDSLQRKDKVNEVHDSNPKNVIDNLIRSHVLASEAGTSRHEIEKAEPSSSYPTRRNASPVRQWTSKLVTPDLDTSESSTKQHPPGTSRHEIEKAEPSSSYPTRRNASPIRQWTSKLVTPDIDASESCTKQHPPGVKEHTLKAKLLEARTRGHGSRLKIFKGLS